MKTVYSSLFTVFFFSFILAGCSGHVGTPTDSIKTIESLAESVFIEIISNSTSTQLSCATTKSVSVQVAIPSGKKVFCRDVSKLMGSIKLGPVCNAGAVLAEFPVNSKVVSCREMTLCGKAPTKVKTVAEQYDGTPVLQLEFGDLPWGCDAHVEISSTESFDKVESSIETTVIPPTCNYCERTGSTTCAACAPLGANEQLVKGQVIPKTCAGGCKTCASDSGPIAHGGFMNFYSRQSPVCGQPCSQISELKVCNNGTWTGDSKFSFEQCTDINDASCTCQHPITRAPVAGNSAPIVLTKPVSDCGKTCADASQKLSVTCESGVFIDSNLNPLSPAQLAIFNSLTCTNGPAVCAASVSSASSMSASTPTPSNGDPGFVGKLVAMFKGEVSAAGGPGSCMAGATEVSNGAYYTFYNTNSGSCANKCSSRTLSRQCVNGAFGGDLSYSYTTCNDVPCGCFLPNDGKTYDSGPTVITIFKTSAPSCGQSCTGNGVSMGIKCQNGTWIDATTSVAVPASAFTTYPAATCSAPKCDCQRLNRLTIPDDGQFHDVYSKTAPTCQENKCSSYKGQVKCTGGVLSGDTAFPYDVGQCTDPVCACTVPLDGGNSASLGIGASISLYKYGSNTPANPSLCSSNPPISVKCTAPNTLSPATYDPAYKFDQCRPSDFSCKVGAYSITYGSSMAFSKTNSPACGVACDIKKVFCKTDGTLVLDSDRVTPVNATDLATAYPNLNSCSPANCDCLANGYVIPYKGSKDFYPVAQGATCDPNACNDVKVTLTCGENKTVTGGVPSANPYTRCETKTCTCPLPNGGSINSGTSLRMFSVDHATCDNRTACEDNNTLVYCTSGALTSYDAATYKYMSCAPATCSCSVNGVEVDFGKDIYFYKTKDPGAGVSCGSVAGHFKCNTGGEITGFSNEDISQYKEISCKSQSDQGDLGGTGGGTGNDEGPGSAIKKRQGLGDGGGGGGNHPCIEGVSCTAYEVQSPQLPLLDRRACQTPWGIGEVEFFGSVIAFDRGCVVQPDFCSNHRQIRSCNSVGFTGSPSFKFPTCVEKPSCP